MADDILVKYLLDAKQYLDAAEKVIKSNEAVGDTAEDSEKKTTKATKKAEKSFKSLDNQIKKVGSRLVAAFAIQKLMSSASRAIIGFDKAMASLGSITGKSGKELDAFKFKILDLSKKTGVSASQVAKSFQLIGSASPELLDSAEALGEVSEQAIILSQAAGIDLEQAADALTKSMNQYGFSASEAAMVTDILATSQQKGTATISQLNESLKNSGSVAKSAGLSFQETNVALQALAKGGLTGAEAGTGLRSVLIKLSKSTRDDLNPTMTSFSDIINTLSKENIGLVEATKLVEAEGARFLTTLVEQNDVVQNLNGNLYDQGNALGQATTNTETLSFAIGKVTTAWETFVLSIEDGDGILARGIKNLFGNVSGFLDLLSDLATSDDQKRIIETAKVIEDFSKVDISDIEDLVAENKKLDSSLDEVAEKAVLAKKKIDEYNVLLSKVEKQKKDGGFTITQKEADNLDKQIDQYTGFIKKLNDYIKGLKKVSSTEGEGGDQKKSLIEAQEELLEQAKKMPESTLQEVILKNREIEAINKKIDALKNLGAESEKERKAREKENESFINLQEDVNSLASKLRKEQQDEIQEGFELEADLHEKREAQKEEAFESAKNAFDRLGDLETEKHLNEQDNNIEKKEDEEAQRIKDKEIANEKVQNGLFVAQALSDIVFSTAKDSKEQAIAKARIDSLLSAISAAANTPTGPIGKAIAAAAALAAGQKIVNQIKSQAIPETRALADGDHNLSGGVPNKDSIPAMLMPGEAVIKKKSNIPELSKAYNEGRIDDYIYANYMIPALKKQAQDFEENKQEDFASKIANSFSLQMHDKNITRLQMKQIKLDKQNSDRLINAMKGRYKTPRSL